MRPSSWRSIALLAALLLARPQQPEWKRVEPGLELAFPADHGAHPAYRTEWWYVTGELADDAGARFGFQFTVFRQGLTPGPARAGESPLRARQVYAGHLALTDVAREETRFAERLRRASPLAVASTTDLALTLEDWSLRRESGDRLALAAGDPPQDFGLELELKPAKPLVLHGERGYSWKGGEPGNASAYVSWTRLECKGRLRTGGRELSVRGSAWFDHEFGSSVLPAGAAGWDWFGLRLDDGRELMLFTLRSSGGGPPVAAAGSLVARDGSARQLASGDFTLASRDTWKSRRTRAEYPARWTIAVPSAALELDVVPLVDDCELVTTGSTGVVYWEGPVEVRGSSPGSGYAELMGYAGSMSERF